MVVWWRVCCVLVGVLCVAADEIHEAETVVTFSRGFANDELARQAEKMKVGEAFQDIRQVVVGESASFLELAEDDANLEENGGWRFPTPVSNPYSIDNSGAFRQSECAKCKPGSVTCKKCVDEVLMSAGPLHFHLVKDLQRRSLIRSVKWGTSAVPPWTVDYPVKRLPDEVHVHRVAFSGEPFATRPIILVTVLPVCDGDAAKCDSKWTDVFATSLSHISTTEFAVNILRLDSLPNNTWGQQIHIAWVAFEPNDAKAMRKDAMTGEQDTHVTLHMGPGV